MDDAKDYTNDADDTGEAEVSNRTDIHGFDSTETTYTPAQPSDVTTTHSAVRRPLPSIFSSPIATRPRTASHAAPAADTDTGTGAVPAQSAAAPFPSAEPAPLTGTNATADVRPADTEAASYAYDLDDSTNANEPKQAVAPSVQNFQRMLMEDDDDDVDLTTKNQFTTVYDLLDQLEGLIEDSKTSFFDSTQVRVDREEVTTLINELKSKLPVQLERASALMRESERRLENAQSQASAIVASANSRAATIIREANDQARFLAGQENVVALATERARTILDKAQAKADKLTQGADNYSAAVLTELSDQLAKAQNGVHNGLAVLAERQRKAAEDLPHLSADDYPQQ
ncbi:cell division protein [Bifidobacterium sp. 82T24]|uniref:cell division protein n=1 Tax=Bifidobacterium pluvialisilvae TaxID=2834436 RepID=UPI001C55992B|nr:cell division protein [Bifidobacterium pluvialisilvae]MBW3087507.1 cell division protein [Bifidobacterium pluvialisilvae]